MQLETYINSFNLLLIDYALLFMCISISILMLSHGIPKLLLLFGSQEISFLDPIGIGETTSLTLAVYAEVICSI